VGGVDDWTAGFGHGHPLLVATVIAVLLGLRHASDPDHLAAVVTIVAAEDDRRVRRAAGLGLVWGIGHGTSLVVFGIPIVVASSYLPAPVRTATDIAVGLTIVALAVRLLVRARPGRSRLAVRSRAAAYGIGLVHGMGGSAGLGLLLLLASITNQALALTALFLFAGCAAISMTMVSAAFAASIDGPSATARINRVAPVLACASALVGFWYLGGAVGLVAYPL
jgi:hypothetical protein